MPEGKKKSGLRADGTPRRPNHREQAQGQSRGRGATAQPGAIGGSRTGAAGSIRGNSTGSARADSTSTARSAATGTGRSTSTGTGRSGAETAGRSGVPGSSRTGSTAARGAATGRGSATTRGTGSERGGSSATPSRSSATLGGSGGTAKRTTASARPTKAPNLKRALPTGDAPIRKPRTKPKQEPTELGEIDRLQKVLANAGIGSRRASEELIAAGRVTVDGQVATLGDKVDPINAEIYVDGERVITDSRRVYLAINKPAGVVSTMSDEKGREALADYLGNVPQRVYHVGRLDAESEGLLLLTNDGTLAHRLMHPSYGVPKTYLVEVPGPIRPGVRQQLLEGVELDDGPVRVNAFRVIDSVGKRVLVEVVLHEGRKHIVRRMMAEVGHPVTRLIRTSIGPIKIGDLKSGRTRRLTRAEIAALFKAVDDDEE